MLRNQLQRCRCDSKQRGHAAKIELAMRERPAKKLLVARRSPVERFVNLGPDLALLLLLGWPGEPIAQGGDHRDRDQPRARQSDQDDERNVARVFTRFLLREHERQEHKDNGECRREERPGEFSARLTDSLAPVDAFGEALFEILRDHNAVIDQQAERDNDGCKAHTL